MYAHIADKNTTKIDIDLEDYSPVAIKGNNLYMANNSGLAPSAVSVFNVKTKKITRVSPPDCSSIHWHLYFFKGTNTVCSANGMRWL